MKSSKVPTGRAKRAFRVSKDDPFTELEEAVYQAVGMLDAAEAKLTSEIPLTPYEGAAEAGLFGVMRQTSDRLLAAWRATFKYAGGKP
jgi:hypothetical protein